MNISDVMSAAEIERITRRNNVKGAWAILCQWLGVVAIFVFVAVWTNPLTVIIGILLLGGRQLGFGILQHECGHKTLFSTPRLNQLVGDWLVSPPGLSNMNAYMRSHYPHHRLAGTHDDPDLSNYRAYPVSRTRLRRKLLRDITGQTGIRTIRFIGRNIRHLMSWTPKIVTARFEESWQTYSCCLSSCLLVKVGFTSCGQLQLFLCNRWSAVLGRSLSMQRFPIYTIWMPGRTLERSTEAGCLA